MITRRITDYRFTDDVRRAAFRAARGIEMCSRKTGHSRPVSSRTDRERRRSILRLYGRADHRRIGIGGRPQDDGRLRSGLRRQQ